MITYTSITCTESASLRCRHANGWYVTFVSSFFSEVRLFVSIVESLLYKNQSEGSKS